MAANRKKFEKAMSERREINEIIVAIWKAIPPNSTYSAILLALHHIQGVLLRDYIEEEEASA
jgi:hypothetical protein